MASVWDATVFAIATVNFEVQNSFVITKDEFGNERTSTDIVAVRVKPRSAAKKYRDMLGLAEQMVLLDCRCVLPEVLPDGVVLGSKGSLKLNGVKGAATLEPIPFTSIKAVQDVLGQRVFISWRAA